MAGHKKQKNRKRTTFLDLPHHVREQIYRIRFVSAESVTWEEHRNFCERNRSYCMHWRPSLARVSKKIDKELSRVYFEENHFYMSSTVFLGAFLRSMTSTQAQSIRHLTFDYRGQDATQSFRTLKKAKGLLSLSIGVDEVEIVQQFCRAENGFRYEAAREMTPQLNLKVLLHAGLDTLRGIRGIPNVRFQAFRHVKNSGPVPEGILESEVAPQMMRQPDLALLEEDPLQPEDSYFPFLRLPAEVRNRIYKQLLVLPCPINPSTRFPTSSTVCGSGAKSGLARPGPIKSSALAILQTNQQVLGEALGIFYAHNHFVFYFPIQLYGFLHAIGQMRRSFIRKVTIWYKNSVEGGMNTIDVHFNMLQCLPSLHELYLVFDEWPGMRHNKTLQPTFAGKDTLRMLRGLEKFTIRNLHFERHLIDIGGNLDDQPEDNFIRKEFKKQYRKVVECEAEIWADVTKPREGGAPDGILV